MSWDPSCEISLSDSEDDDTPLTGEFYGRESIIFVIDANLYNKSELLENALLMIRGAFLSGLLVNDKDLMGIIFFNTEHSPEPFESKCLDEIILPKYCAVFLPPRQLSNAIVNHFLNFVEIAPVQFGKIYGVAPSTVGCNFSQMLRLSVDLVQHCNVFVDSTSIVFITDNELPHPFKSECYMQSLQKAADLKDNNIEFILIPMKNEFNYNLFYREFICLMRDIDIDAFEACNADKLREMLANRKLRRNFLRRSLGHFNFELAPNLVLSAQYFGYYQKNKRPHKILLQRCDNALVKKSRHVQAKKINSNLFEEVRNINIKHAFYEVVFSNNSIRLSYEQINRIRNIHKPGMILLGFKPHSLINGAKYSKSSNFMYADDVQVEGSKRLFRALWERCLVKKKVAICLFMCKRKSMPRYVALIPVSKEKSDLEDLAFTSDGFKIVYLTADSNIRNFDLTNWRLVNNQAINDELTICEKLIKKFKLDYKSDFLSDPDLDQLQAKLLSLAFNINYESFGRQYFPNPSQQDIRINSILPKIKEIFGLERELPKKRAVKDKTGLEKVDKKLKLSPNTLDEKSLVLQMIAKKTLNTCTKEQLFYILKKHFNKNVPSSLKKQDLLDIIYNL